MEGDTVKPQLTIHTATYNRGNLLEKVYKSLQNQTCFDFEWLVTDDGSTDHTSELFEKWLKENNPFEIRYVKLNHGGLIRAVNHAISIACGRYYFRLDSDDQLLPNAVDIICEKIREIDDIDKIVGIGFVIVNIDGVPLKGSWPIVNQDGYVDCSNLQRKQFNLDADMREAYKVSILKKYPFPVWKDELFAPEQLQMDAMALDGYKIRWYSIAVYEAEYHDGGLTKDNWNLLRKNKMGYAMLSNQRLLYAKSFKERFKAAGQHIALSIIAGYPGYILQSNKLLLTLLALPYGILLSFHRREQFKWDDPINRRNNE